MCIHFCAELLDGIIRDVVVKVAVLHEDASFDVVVVHHRFHHALINVKWHTLGHGRVRVRLQELVYMQHTSVNGVGADVHHISCQGDCGSWGCRVIAMGGKNSKSAVAGLQVRDHVNHEQ